MSKEKSCDLCPKAFASSSSLSHHKKTHSGVKKFSCVHCGKSFGENGDLKKHSLMLLVLSKTFTAKKHTTRSKKTRAGVKVENM